MRLIGCRNCDSAYCDGCNIYILATMLNQGKFDCLMDDHHTITIDPEELRPKGEWTLAWLSDWETKWECSNCKSREHTHSSEEGELFPPKPYCPNCGAKMRGADG